ncbi:flagellar motor stator protein MotA [Paenibacillus aurantiacus]|uniref:Flagellar motor stator protein MotA n=1 Tax=Paenibacillus aurantiacus TaxID=1936118 RepID=A0ABV5KZU9_9BACL
MEKSTLIGVVLALISIFVGMVLKGAPLGALMVPAAYLIIIGGTASTLFIGFPMAEVMKLPTLLKLIFKEQKLIQRQELITMFVDWASVTRREGLLALESKVEEIQDGFLRNGMRMIIDGNDQDLVHDVLMEDIAATEERHRVGAQIFTQGGTYAPTLGVLGAVVGLIAALQDMADMEKLAHAIAGAFIATLLGIFVGYVVCHPISNKLKRLSKREMEIKTMMVEGLLSIQSGVSTTAINQKLSVYLTPTERAKMEQKGAVAGE